MSTNFPTSLDVFTAKVDGVDTVQAAHINNMQDAIAALEAAFKTGNLSGNWTPTDQSGAALSFAAATGVYFRIGDLVVALFQVTYPATASGANAVIGGMPFTVNGANGTKASALSYCSASTVRYATPVGSSTTFAIQDSSGVAITNATMSGKMIQGAIIYSR